MWIDGQGVVHVSVLEASDPNFDPGVPFFKIDNMPDPASQAGKDFSSMDEATQNAMIEMEARQNGLICEALKRFRQGLFPGATGIDAIIVALQSGKPLDFTPSYPPNT